MNPRVARGPILVFGGSPLGNLFAEVSDLDARHTLESAWNAGIRHFDTAPFYGSGLSEERIGGMLAGVDADTASLSTKVGRSLVKDDGARRQRHGYHGHPIGVAHDFSRDAIRRSLDGSLTRLAVGRVNTVYLHDPDDHIASARTEGFPALLELRDEGILESIGVGTNSVQTALNLVLDLPLDCVMVAGRWTLADREAGRELLPLCKERGVAVHAAGVFNSGILATGDPKAPYQYGPASPQVLERVSRIREICAQYDVALGAAALQFAARHPSVTRIVVGIRSTAELATDLQLARADIPESLWTALEELE